MYDFEISKKGWLITHSNENQIRINLNNVSRIQTWISQTDIPTSRSVQSYIIAFELSSKVEFTRSKELINLRQVEQAFWGFENVFTLMFTREDLWLTAMSKIDAFIKSN